MSPPASMPQRPCTFPLPTICALLIFFVMSPQLRVAAAQDDSDDKQAAQSEVPIRSRDYVDDYAQLNALREGVVSLPSGVQYEVLKSGNGKPPCATDMVMVHYRAMLPNGVEFDNTYERGAPTTLALDEYLVPGLKEALLLMKEGDEWRVTIPANMGFRGGRLLRKRDLIYEITLLAIVAPAETENDKSASH